MPNIYPMTNEFILNLGPNVISPDQIQDEMACFLTHFTVDGNPFGDYQYEEIMYAQLDTIMRGMADMAGYSGRYLRGLRVIYALTAEGSIKLYYSPVHAFWAQDISDVPGLSVYQFTETSGDGLVILNDTGLPVFHLDNNGNLADISHDDTAKNQALENISRYRNHIILKRDDDTGTIATGYSTALLDVKSVFFPFQEIWSLWNDNNIPAKIYFISTAREERGAYRHGLGISPVNPGEKGFHSPFTGKMANLSQLNPPHPANIYLSYARMVDL